MAATIVTLDDFLEFKAELFQEIRKILKDQSPASTPKWLKSPELKKMLGISSGTLQNLRVNGTLPYTKIGGVIYYDYSEILKIIEANKIHNKLKL